MEPIEDDAQFRLCHQRSGMDAFETRFGCHRTPLHHRPRRAIRHLGRLAVVCFLAAAGSPGVADSVLMISVDGMKPEYVTQADARGLKIPFLRKLLSDGTHAEGVVGVLPTITYPSHTTLVTGVSPREHGIYNNVEFDPKKDFGEAWYWYAQQIRAPTLWQAAHRAGIRTASVSWPVTVGCPDIDFLIPEYWRIFRPTPELNPSDRYLIAALSRPEGLLTQLQQSLGPYLMGNDTSRAADEIRTRFAVEILRRHKPRFMTVHLSSLDDAEHEHGPFSTEANEDLEAIDGMLAALVAASQANDPAAIALVVSDHGFAPLRHRVNLFVPFIDAGLIEMSADAEGKSSHIASWQAEPWLAGGSAAIMLHDPQDVRTEQRVRELLHGLAGTPANGISAVLERNEIKRRGGFPDAAFVVLMQLGFYTGANQTGELITDFQGAHGGHGFSPEFPEMRASLFLMGAGIASGKNLGVIDMRQIAPTVAQLLGVPLPSATAPALKVHPP